MAADWLKRLTALALLLTLSSCYIPDKFRAELRLSRFGDYDLTYKGDLMWAPILDDYRTGKITPDNEVEKIENIRKDLVRDIAFRKIESRGRGRFAVEYERAGRLGQVQLVALIRRDARILMLRGLQNGGIVVTANSLRPSDAQTMAELGLTMEGEFRVTTDANVVDHNATEVRQFGNYRVYVWKIDGPLAPAPHLAMVRDSDPRRPLPPPPSSKLQP